MRTVVLTLERSVNAGDPVEVNYFLMMGGIPVIDLSGNEHWAGGPAPVHNRTAEVVELAPLTAGFANVPPEHDGASVFELKLVFSEEARMSYKVIGTHLLTVSGGTLKQAKRVIPPKNKEYRLRIKPSGDNEVVLTLNPGNLPPCGQHHQICTADGRALQGGTVTKTIPGPVSVSVAGATVEEGPGAVLEFVVSLSRARHEAVSVDYATADQSATAGEDYVARSGTLNFDPGQTEMSIEVEVLEDPHDDGGETMKLTLSNPQPAAYVRITNAQAVGTIENDDPMPKAWALRFARTTTGQRPSRRYTSGWRRGRGRTRASAASRCSVPRPRGLRRSAKTPSASPHGRAWRRRARCAR